MNLARDQGKSDSDSRIESAPGATGRHAKELLILAADHVLDALLASESAYGEVATQFVEDGALPARYLEGYEADFLQRFHNVLEIVRNCLVGDLPHLSSVAEELASRVIFERAGHLTAGLPDVLARADSAEADEIDRSRIVAELEDLQGVVTEDLDVLSLFGDDPVIPQRLAFENWFLPYGNPPRPVIAEDGRAWPA